MYDTSQLLLIGSLAACLATAGCGEQRADDIHASPTTASASGSGGSGGGGGEAGGGGSGGGGSFPNQLSGTFQVSKYTTWEGTVVGARGRFLAQAFPSDSAELRYYDDIAVGTCAITVLDPPSGDGGGSAAMLDAGPALAIAGPKGTLTLLPGDILEEAYYDVEYADPSFFVPHGAYALQGNGGAAVPAFNASLAAPGDLAITEPVLSNASSLHPITLGSDLPIAWSSPKSDEMVFVRIAQFQSDGSTVVSQCRFADEGAATVAASALASFVPSPPDEELPDAFLDIRKYTWTSFDVGLAAPALFEFESAWFTYVRFDAATNAAPAGGGAAGAE